MGASNIAPRAAGVNSVGKGVFSAFGCEWITPDLAFEDGLAVLAHDRDFELFASVDVRDLGCGGDGVADKDRGGEFPVLAQEDGAGAGHVHGDEG
ncbi:MAG: hypothetical protein VX293_10555, partial [Candidatus Latescibacterota bacterium]|nr:hypothetical protein [Candidatus Latescibacterota bacterium]